MLNRFVMVVVVAQLVGCASVGNEELAASSPGVIDCAVTVEASGPGHCEVLSVGDRNTIITATILTDDQVLNNGSILIDENGMIVDVSCDVRADDRARNATVLACPGGIVSPGFINAHDHIWYNHRPPSNLTAERYDHRHQWRLGLEGHTQPDYERAESIEQVAWGEIRHALSATTSIAGMGGVPGLVRNLEDPTLIGNLETAAAFATVFPLGDPTGTMLSENCEYPELVDPSKFANAGSFQAHVAEGVDRRAANEIACITGQADDSVDVTTTPAAFVHFVGASTDDAVLLRDRDVSVIWSPRSNIALYGHTANVTLLDRLGVNIALSTDWLPSGSMNLLREIRCGADYSNDYLDGYFSYRDLWKMVTVNAARSFALQDELGSLAPGKVADIAVFRDGPASDPFEDIINASDSDVLLVLRAGRPLAGKSTLVSAFGADCDTLPIELTCGEQLAVCMDAADGMDLQAVLDTNRDSYLLMSCGSVPQGEPSCTPSWPNQFDGRVMPGDDDGDGVKNALDNCPLVFNPPRPMDGSRQTDWDQDTVGDACDEFPLESSTNAN